MKPLHYYFYPVTHCNMCGSEGSTHKLLGQRLNQSQGFRPKTKKGISTSIMKCDSCNLIYSNPQPVPFDIQDHYGIPPESYWIEEYFKVNPEYYKWEIDTFKKLEAFQPGMKALDVGAGIGKCMIALQNAGFDAYGFEPSVPFYERAIGKMGIDPAKLKRGMLEEVDYPENEFDFVTMGNVLEHVYDANAAISRAMKWLKPNGLLHIEVPNSAYLVGKLLNFFYALRGTNYVTSTSPMHSPFHMYEFGLKSFEKNKQINNYTIAQQSVYAGITIGMPRLLMPFFAWLMKKTNTGIGRVIWLRKNEPANAAVQGS